MSAVIPASGPPSVDVIVDESYFPLVFNVFPARVDVANIERYCKRFERILQRGEPFACIADATAATERPPPTVRKQLADWTRSIDAELARLSKGDARVVRSSIIRGAMTAISWLHKSPVPLEWFTSTDAAIIWSLARLDEAHVNVPKAVRDRALARAKA